MKELWIVRHAAAENSSLSGDRQRSLSDRGLRQIRVLQELLQGQGAPQAVLVSPATRARQTADGLFLEGLGLEPTQIEVVDALYLADGRSLCELLMERPYLPDHVAIVGHNPGLSDLLNDLCERPRADLSTATVARLDLPIEHWPDLGSVHDASSELVQTGI